MREAKICEKQPKITCRHARNPLFNFEFNRSVKLRSQTANVTANAGVLLLREADHCLDITQDIVAKLHDHRHPDFIRYPLAELLRERIYALALGHSRQDDADILAHDPAFKTAVWQRPGCRVADERLASQPTVSRFMSILAQEQNLEKLREAISLPLLRHQRCGQEDRRVSLGVVDIDGFPIETHGEQPGAAYNGYYQKTIYSPLAAYFSTNGDFTSRRLGDGFLHAKLRIGNAPPAGDAELFLDQVMDKARQLARTVAIRIDAGFADAKLFNRIDRAGARFTVRLPSNPAIDRLAQPFLVRPSGRPPKNGYEFAIELTGYINPGWDRQYRVILVVVDKPDKNGWLSLFPNYFFIATNWPDESMSPWRIVEHYRQRGTFEDRLGEWNALGVNLSQDSFEKNEATLLLSMLAFNLLEILRREIESATDIRLNPPAATDSGWDMSRLRNILLKAGAVLSRGGRRLWFDLAEGIAPLWQSILERIRRWRKRESPIRHPPTSHPGFAPLPGHAFLKYMPRL